MFVNSTTVSSSQVDALEQISRRQSLDEVIFLGLQVLGGQLLLPLLVLTIVFSRNVRRNPVFINFCCSWILSSVIYSLLVYRGRSDPDYLSLHPSPLACLVQASLINGVQPLTASTTLGIAIQLLTSLLSVKRGESEVVSKRNRLSVIALLIAPYVVFLIFTSVSALLGSREALNPDKEPIPGSNLAAPGVFYCIIVFDDFEVAGVLRVPLDQASFYFSLSLSSLSLFLEALTVIIIIKNWRIFCKVLPIRWTQLLFRVVAFSLFRLALLFLMFQSPLITRPEQAFLTGIYKDKLYNGLIDFMQASVPLAVFLVFASEKDILNAWCFWRTNPSPPLSVIESEDSASIKSEALYYDAPKVDYV